MGRTVLIVDDDRLLREAMALDFRRRNYNVFLAQNGSEAFEIVQSQKVDVVLSDIRMPNGDGVSLLRNIRELHHEMPIVFLITGFADLTLEDAYHYGAAAVIAKPFNRRALYEAIDRALMPKAARWDNPSDQAFTHLNVQLAFSNILQAVEGRVLNLGNGGMFVELKGIPDVAIGSEVQFSIQLSSVPDFVGRGVVRWMRRESLDNLPRGCGIEFLHVNESMRGEVVGLVDRLQTKSFIPKY